MKKPRLKVILIVDTEADFYYYIPSPHFSKLDMLKWKLNKLAGKLYKYPWPSRKGFINLVKCLKKYNQKVTFCIVGHLYLKECSGWPHFEEKKPKHSWYYNKIGRNWYYWDKGGNYLKKPGLYLGDIIDKIKDNKLFSFGLHGFSHEALSLEPKEVIDSIVSAGIKAAKKLGIKINSFAAPFELTEDKREPGKLFNILRKHKIKRIFYAGKDDGLIIKRHLAIKKPTKEKGLEKIWISGYFDGASKKEHITKIIKEIKRNMDKNAVYCLATHDFTHKSTKNLERILRFLKNEDLS